MLRWLALALVPALLLRPGMSLAALKAALAAPVINDVATDTVEPPAFAGGRLPPLPQVWEGRDEVVWVRRGRGRPRRHPLPVFSQAFVPKIRAAYPDLAPLALALPPDAAFKLVVKTAASAMGGWELGRTDAGAREVEGVATTALLRFKDDLIFRVRAADGGGSIVDGRSRSRLGQGDLGANAARLRAFFKKVAAAAAAAAP